MTKADMRKEPRIARARKATLLIADQSVACVIQDLSMSGFLIMCTRPAFVGDVLELRCELYTGRVLNCKIQVRRDAGDMCLGTEIVEVTDAGRRLCREFLEEHYSDRLKFG